MLVIVLLVSLFPGTMSSPAPRWVPISPPTDPDAADFEPFLQDGQFPEGVLSDGFDVDSEGTLFLPANRPATIGIPIDATPFELRIDSVLPRRGNRDMPIKMKTWTISSKDDFLTDNSGGGATISFDGGDPSTHARTKVEYRPTGFPERDGKPMIRCNWNTDFTIKSRSSSSNARSNMSGDLVPEGGYLCVRFYVEGGDMTFSPRIRRFPPVEPAE